MSNNRPNILIALADDASHFGIYGNDFVQTPNLDWVGRNGVVFNNAFTPNPKCAPSRACMLTGRFPWQNEDACLHFNIFPSNMTLYPDVLERAGYHVGFTGKGWGPGDYKRNGYPRNPAGNEYNQHELTPPDGTEIKPCDYTANFAEFLADVQEGEPFCFWYGCREPHRPYKFGEGHRLPMSSDDLEGKLPSYWPDTPEVREDVLDYASEINWFDLHLGNMLDMLGGADLLGNTIVIVASDNGCPFPRVKGQMYEQDMHIPMVACWLNHMKGGRKVNDFVSYNDLAPTLLDLAGVEIPPEMTGKSFRYIFETEKDGWVDASRNEAYFGRERHDVGRESDLGYPVRCIRTPQYLYSRNFAPDRWPAGNPETGFTNCDDSPTKDEVLRRMENGDKYYFDLSFGKRPAEELFDIVRDPECMNNLAEEPDYAAIKEELSQKLHDMLVKTNDPRITIDPNYFEGREYVGNMGHSWEAYRSGHFTGKKRYHFDSNSEDT